MATACRCPPEERAEEIVVRRDGTWDVISSSLPFIDRADAVAAAASKRAAGRKQGCEESCPNGSDRSSEMFVHELAE